MNTLVIKIFNLMATRRFLFCRLLSCTLFLITPPSLAREMLSYAYITNQGEDTVSVIDTTKNSVSQTIAVGKGPVGIAVSASMQRVYIANVESQEISVINTQNNSVIQTIKINGAPVGLTLSPDNSTLYVADWFANKVLAISTQLPTALRELNVGDAPAG